MANSGDPAREADVAVVGAGLAGLSAARELHDRGLGVVVIEARDRLGGRVYDHALDGETIVELGGQYCTPAGFGTVANHAIVDLAETIGNGVAPTHDAGKKLLILRDRRHRYTGTIPPLDPTTLLAFALGRWRLGRIVKRVPPACPWKAASAAELDAQTVSSWANRTLLNEGARRIFRLATEAVMAADPDDVSLLHLATYLARNGTLEAMTGTSGAAQSHRIRGGPQALAERLAQPLGDSVLLASPVSAIKWSTSSTTVIHQHGSVKARRVIVAAPPPLASRISYDPPLPGGRDQLAQRMPQGAVVKLVALYSEPFWRHDGLSGQASIDHGPIRVVFDHSPLGSRTGALAAYAVGRSALELSARSSAERQALALDTFARLFGPRARAADGYLEHDWIADAWARGGYNCFTAPGTIVALGRHINAPVGPIHWAGTETATSGFGSMSGALLSGRRAASEIIGALQPSEPAAHPEAAPRPLQHAARERASA